MNASPIIRNLLFALALLVGAASTARARSLPAHSVLQSARALHRDSLESGRLPDQLSMAMASGDTTLTAGQALLAFAEALGALSASGRLPDTIAVAEDARARVSAVPPGSPGRAPVSVAALGQQCRALGEMSGLLGGLPIAVWVEGQRLTLAEFLSAVVAALSEAAERGRLPGRVAIGAVAPPAAWTNAAAGGWRVNMIRPRGGEGEQPEPLLPATEGPAVRAQPEPRPLSLSLADGATVSGSVVLRADVWPEPRMLILSIDGQQRALLNVRPYQFPIDTRNLDNGPHRIRVQSYGSARGIETAEIMVAVANE